jgi:hypothetical protein
MHFPEIMHYGETEGRSYYEMKHYPLPSMRRLIFTNKLTVNDVVNWMGRITSFSLELNSYEKLDIPDNYVKFMHWDRFFSRRNELLSNTRELNEYVLPEKIEVNGNLLRNAHIIIHDLMSRNNDFIPPFVGRWSHSDLHFSNVLIDLTENTFRCVDPRGYPYCDVFYDFGKLYHSVNGKYEMVVNDMWIKKDEFKYEFVRNNYFKFLEELKEKLINNVFLKYSPLNNIEETMKLIEFNEAIHFITLVPFQLTHDGKEDRAKVAYMIGVELLNVFYNKYYDKN